MHEDVPRFMTAVWVNLQEPCEGMPCDDLFVMLYRRQVLCAWGMPCLQWLTRRAHLP